MEVLSRKLMAETLKKKSRVGFRMGTKGPIIPCLLFADDDLIFCKADKSTADSIKRILDEFCEMTGQLVNFHKSSIVFLKGTYNNVKTHMVNCLGIPIKESDREIIPWM